MKNDCQTKSSTLKSLTCVLSLFFFTCLSLSVNAQNAEQKIVNKVPKHLPIKIEILNQDVENLLSDVKIKVTNTGERSIYFLKFFISTKEDFLAPSGNQYGFALRYGRNALVDVDELAAKEDISLKKGESYIFKVDENASKRFNEEARESYRAKPETYLLEFQMLSFGDGTGFLGSKARPVYSDKKSSQSFGKYLPFQKLTGFFLTEKKNQPV